MADIIEHDIEFFRRVIAVGPVDRPVLFIEKQQRWRVLYFQRGRKILFSHDLVTDRDFTVATIAAPSAVKAEAEEAARKAAEAGCLGFLSTNASPAMAPWGGRSGTFGTTPIAFACPREDAPPLVVDLSRGQEERRAGRRQPVSPARLRLLLPGHGPDLRHSIFTFL